MGNDKKPAIRFKGFTDAWEQRKLSEVCSNFEYGLNAAATDYDGKNKYIRITDIDDASHRFILDDVTSPDTDLTVADNYKLVANDLLFARTGASVGKTYLYRDFDGLIYYAGFLIRAKIKPEYDAEFIFQNTMTDEYNRFIRITSQRSGQPGVNAQEYADYSLMVPTKLEQEKIGGVFLNLDNLITLHQRKCDRLQNVKKSMLEKMFPKNGESVPEIRFKGFTDAWEQRKLGEVGKCQSGIGFPDSEQGGRVGVPFYKVSDMNNYGNEQEMNNANNYVSIEQIKRKNWKPIEEVPAVIFAKVGAAIMLNRKRLCRFPFLLDNNTMAYKFDNSWNTDFGKTLFEKIDLTALVQVGALPSYNASDVEETEIFRPCNPIEQQQIGMYFKQLDNLITLHQRKCDRLQNVKKSMLEKMFPKNGESVPEIRFSGFTDAWEQRKLGKCAEFNPKSDLPDEFEYVDLESVVGTEMISHRTENKSNAPSRAQRLAQKGDLFYQTVRPYQRNNHLFEKDDNDYVFSTGYAQMRPSCDSYFLLCLVQDDNFIKVVLDNCTGTSYPAINSSDLANIEVKIPLNLSEQQQIGDYFRSLDTLITLHQRELEKLKNIKKSCLEKMFV